MALSYVRTKFKLLSTFSKRKAAEKAFDLFCTPQRRVTKAPTAIFEKAKKLEFLFEGELIKGFHWGNALPKKLLLLHGFESSIINFGHFVQPLMDKGYEVFGVDATAHGRSTGKRINAVLYKELILYMMQEFGSFDAFISHSLGGLALSLALEEANVPATTKAVFIAPATETATAAKQLFQFLQLNAGVQNEFDAVIQDQSGHPTSWFSVARAIQNIKAKILWIHDEDDEMTPLNDVKKIIGIHPSNIDFFITKGLGHRRIYRDAAVLQKIISFL